MSLRLPSAATAMESTERFDRIGRFTPRAGRARAPIPNPYAAAFERSGMAATLSQPPLDAAVGAVQRALRAALSSGSPRR